MLTEKEERDMDQMVIQALKDISILFLFYYFIVLETAGNRGHWLGLESSLLEKKKKHSVKQVSLKHDFIHSTNIFFRIYFMLR